MYCEALRIAADALKKQIPKKVIEDLNAEFVKAEKLEFVKNPVAYALYQTWKKYDCIKKKGE